MGTLAGAAESPHDHAGQPLQTRAAGPACRHCGADLHLILADLGSVPVANDYIDPERHGGMEPFYPLQVLVCTECRLAQTHDLISRDDVFRADYAYFSSHSTSWLKHARVYVEQFTARFGLGAGSCMVEVASNDGYLLQYAQRAGIPCLGIEPCRSVAMAAMAKGIPTRMDFFGRATARTLRSEGIAADLITANNVLAHVQDINDFVGGAAILLAPEGVATFEVQHLLRLMQRNQFDTIYHEHFSYLSLLAARNVFERAGLRVFDVDELATHGGSIRFIVCRNEASHVDTPAVARVLQEELDYGLGTDAVYERWSNDICKVKRDLLKLLISVKEEGKSIAAYGAPAKGVTLLNYCGIARDFIDFTVDRAPSKQGRLMPGVRIPILAPDAIMERRPDYILILPWNLKSEIKSQLSGVKEWGARFILPIPTPVIED
jgi:hypothetical protein